MICVDSKYSTNQWLILIVSSVIYFLFNTLISIKAPFYPLIAEKKGVTATQIGIVFGTFSLANFFFSPFAAEIIKKFRITILSLLGLFVTGISNILFGFIENITGLTLFLGLSIAIGILEAVGVSLTRNVTISVVCFEFSENVEMAFAFIQMVYSFANILAPVIGGSLIEVSGFFLPFTIFGILLLCTAIPVLILHKPYPKEKAKLKENIIKLFPLPQVIFGTFALIGAFINEGFINVTLEQHLKDFNLSPIEIGLIFLCKELASGSSVLFWSKLNEKYECEGTICFVSSILKLCGLMLLGPAPYIPLHKSIYTILLGLIFNSIGIGGAKIGGYSFFHRGARIAGLSKTMQTYGLLSSMFTSSLSLGHCIGALFGGFLFDTFGFGWGSHFFILYHFITCGGSFFYYYFLNATSDVHENQNIAVQGKNSEMQTYSSTE